MYNGEDIGQCVCMCACVRAWVRTCVCLCLCCSCCYPSVSVWVRTRDFFVSPTCRLVLYFCFSYNGLCALIGRYSTYKNTLYIYIYIICTHLILSFDVFQLKTSALPAQPLDLLWVWVVQSHARWTKPPLLLHVLSLLLGSSFISHHQAEWEGSGAHQTTRLVPTPARQTRYVEPAAVCVRRITAPSALTAWTSFRLQHMIVELSLVKSSVPIQERFLL